MMKDRFLAAEEAVRIDYSVLNVAVLTLGAIMMVEVLRHKLDATCRDRPFYRAVLEGVYAELATLGIVEFFLHVFTENYKEYDKAKKQVFADVHFLLFYTAIFNALQSLLLAHVVRKISHSLWVETESLEINHYVEIREEFQRVQALLGSKRGAFVHNNNVTDQEAHEMDNISLENVFSFDRASLASWMNDMIERIRYPALNHKYNALLVQIRFHELRVHFLQAYSLPLKLKISDYLLRCEQNVLLKLVHVSSIAWLLLTGIVNIFYYVLGVLSYKTKDPELVGTAMSSIFFAAIILFVLLSGLVYNKMRSIFRSIMLSRTMWDVSNADDQEKLAAKQRSLFWGSDPKYVVVSIQFMQFGFAVAISTIITFWEEIGEGPIGLGWYFGALLLCYLLFVAVTGKVLPRFTLCTSLGQLVDEQRLHETLAVFRLEDAKQKETIYRDQHRLDEPDSLRKSTPSSLSTKVSSANTIPHKSSRTNKTTKKPTLGRRESVNAALMAKMVKVDTLNLRRTLDFVRESTELSSSGALDQMMTNGEAHRADSLLSNSDDDEELDDTSLSSSCCSDVDDVPEVDVPNIQEIAMALNRRKAKTFDRIYCYFRSKRYVLISNVFGTMVAFYLVGHRVESFLLSEGISSEAFVHFDLPNAWLFWALFTWLVAFLIISTTSLCFVRSRFADRKDKELVSASVFDLLLTGSCLLFLLVAETQRCCYAINDHRTLAEVTTTETAYETGELAAPCSCPRFGSRLYGGLGYVEPFVSLVALRVLRRWIAKRLVKRFWPHKSVAEGESPTEENEALQSDPFAVFVSEKGSTPLVASMQSHGKKHNHPTESVGTAAELWEKAIVKNPDLVAKHGEFSVEVLCAMLGLEPTRAKEKFGKPPSPSSEGQSKLSGLTRLKAAAKKIVVANRFGRPLTRLSAKELEDAQFRVPYAPVVRSMRRCDRKFVPILDKWCVVDVVITRYEMVYFDAAEVNDTLLGSAGVETKEKVVATKGGKGMRLCEIATGRKIVGQLLLSDISTLHVERIVHRKESEYFETAKKTMELHDPEFWKTGKGRDTSTEYGSNQIIEDRLKIQTTHGHTLSLRFYSDIENMLRSPEKFVQDQNSTLEANNALQWAQTIGRFCDGPLQLQQPLPNFGDGSHLELHDYLLLAQTDSEAPTLGRPESLASLAHRRMSSSIGFFTHRRRSTALESSAFAESQNLDIGFSQEINVDP